MFRRLIPLVFMATAAAAEELPTNPSVTQDNLAETVCMPGWSKMVRPPVSYTNAIKRQRLQDAGLPLELIADFRLDHRISISLGGSPEDPRNLALEDNDDAGRKDREEARLHRAVCDGRISLREAQRLLWEWKPQ